MDEVTAKVKAFYEENPFPNYDDIDSRWTLREKARKSVFARLLDEQLPPNARILEVGCGTGQLANFLAMTPGRTVVGTDISRASLRLAEEFRRKQNITNALFLERDLFNLEFPPESFDLVIANGVLHHTPNPFGGFHTIGELVKPGGYILVGLYNRSGRFFTHIRRFFFRLFGARSPFPDPRLKASLLRETRTHTWFLDQYKNPHESSHAFGEVLRWFDRTGFQFLSSIPKAVAGERFLRDEKLFEPHPAGSALDHFLVELNMLFADREGGLFLLIGRKK